AGLCQRASVRRPGDRQQLCQDRRRRAAGDGAALLVARSQQAIDHEAGRPHGQVRPDPQQAGPQPDVRDLRAASVRWSRPVAGAAGVVVPLAVLVFGTRLQNKLFLVTFACLWPLLFQAIYGVQDVDPVAVDTARAFGFGRFSRLFLVVLPAAAPYIATGLRIASSVAL